MAVIACLPIQLEESHAQELKALILSLADDVKNGTLKNTKNFERFEKILILYEEEPNLLDPIIKELLQNLLNNVNLNRESKSLSHLDLSAIYRLFILIKVRGAKTIVNFLPHGIELLEVVLHHIETISKSDSDVSLSRWNKWNILYVLTLWLSIICRNPFNLNVNGKNQTNERQEMTSASARTISCLESLLRMCIPTLELKLIPNLLAHLLTRDHSRINQLHMYFEKFQRSFLLFDTDRDSGSVLIRDLQLAIDILKQCPRKVVQPFSTEILKSIPKKFVDCDCPNIEIRNLVCKLLQRLALVLMKPKAPNWLYSCGVRSLRIIKAEKCQSGSEEIRDVVSDPSPNDANKLDDVDSSELTREDNSKLIKLVIDSLMDKIYDRDNLVRWTAAKGLSRICSRLTQYESCAIVSSVISKFSQSNSISNWHGGCLTLAELSQRSCLLPNQISLVIDEVVAKALLFDQPGSVCVRDAACYICWSFSRAYDPKILTSANLAGLAEPLVCLALFDRESNIRRAASASFQENVGRNGLFLHGIPILSVIDYSSVALIRHSYLVLSLRIAKFEEYVKPMIDHLVYKKSIHWDEEIRELAAECLQEMVCYDSDYSLKNVFPRLVARLESDQFDSASKHGISFSIGCVLIGLHTHNLLLSIDALDCNVCRIINYISKQSKLLDSHRSKGFSLIAKSLSHLIGSLCMIGTTLNRSQISEFHDILDKIMVEKDETMRSCASRSLSFVMRYYINDISLLLIRFNHTYFPLLEKPPSEDIRSSVIMSLSCFPIEALKFEVQEFDECTGQTIGRIIMDSLLKVLNDSSTPKWVFARVAAIEASSKIISLFVPPNFSWNVYVQRYLNCCDDYTTTINGGIGRFVRKSAIFSLCKIVKLAFSISSTIVSNKSLDNIIGKMIEHFCEPLDEISKEAYSCILELFYWKNSCLPISERDLLEIVFIKNNAFSDDFVPDVGSLPLEKLLGSPTYGTSILTGLVRSSGNISQWTSRRAFLSIERYLKCMKNDRKEMENFLNNLVFVNSQIIQQDSTYFPLIRLLPLFMNERLFDTFELQPDDSDPFKNLCEIVIKVVLDRGKPKMKLDAIKALGSLLQINRQSQLYLRILKLLVSLLTSPYTALRQGAVEQLFEHITLIDDIESSDQELALQTLQQNEWCSPDPLLHKKASAEVLRLLIRDPLLHDRDF